VVAVLGQQFGDEIDELGAKARKGVGFSDQSGDIIALGDPNRGLVNPRRQLS
jgi:hypothetical protein